MIVRRYALLRRGVSQSFAAAAALIFVLAALGGWLYARSHHLVSKRRDAVAPDPEDLAV